MGFEKKIEEKVDFLKLKKHFYYHDFVCIFFF